MKLETIQQNGQTVAVMTSGTPVMTDVQSALDLLMTARYEAGTNRIAIEKAAVAEAFFVLSTRLAGRSCRSSSTTRESWPSTGTSPTIPASLCGTSSMRATRGGTCSLWRQRRRLWSGWRPQNK